MILYNIHISITLIKVCDWSVISAIDQSYTLLNNPSDSVCI